MRGAFQFFFHPILAEICFMKGLNLLILIFFFCNGTWAEQVTLTPFETKCYTIWKKKGKQACIEYIEKKLAQASLDGEDQLNAYFIKAELYLPSTDQGPNIDKFRMMRWTNADLDKYTIQERLDSSLHYALRLSYLADKEYLFKKEWIRLIYNPLCQEIINSWELEHPLYEQLNHKHYYNFKDQCDRQFQRIKNLKVMVKPFHPINQLGLNLVELKMKTQLGLLKEAEFEKTAAVVYDYILNENGYYYDQSLFSTNFERTYSFMNLNNEIKGLISCMWINDQVAWQSFLNKCPQYIFNSPYYSFDIFKSYDLKWSIRNATYKDRKLGIIDLRDSALFLTMTFPLYYEVIIDYDIPINDTLILDKIEDNSRYPTTELINTLHLSGKGSDTLKIKFYVPLPPPNSTSRFDRKIKLISNRGMKSFQLEAEIIGQSEITEAAKADRTVYNYSGGCANYQKGVFSIIVSPDYNTDTLKIYRYPQNKIPACLIVNSQAITSTELVFPIERRTDSLYHFQFLGETTDYYHVVYSNYGLNSHNGWLKKSDFDTTKIALSDLVEVISWDDYYKEGDSILLRNPMQRVRASNGYFTEDYRPTCDRYKYISLETDFGYKMKIAPCQNCTDTTLLRAGYGWIDWCRDEHVYVERIKN